MLFTEEQKLEIVKDIFKHLQSKFDNLITNKEDYTIETRRESLKAVLPKMKSQKEICYECIKLGINDAVRIEEFTGMNHDSCKRAISVLKSENKIKAVGKREGIYGVDIAYYKITDEGSGNKLF